MQAIKERVEQCVYCGADGSLTRDHIPPKGIFPKPRPGNLVTVPACKTCHSQQTSKDDEYFRNALTVREELSEHPEIMKARPSVMRALLNPNKEGMRREFMNNIRVIEQVTAGGIFVKRQLGLQTDMVRLRRIVQRTLIGLFYHHKGYRVPADYEALIADEESLQKRFANDLAFYNEHVIKPLRKR